MNSETNSNQCLPTSFIATDASVHDEGSIYEQDQTMNVFSSPLKQSYSSQLPIQSQQSSNLDLYNTLTPQHPEMVNPLLVKFEQENEALRLYAARCEQELQHYQMQFPNLMEQVARSYIEHVDPGLTPWITNQKILNPLLVAYEHRILMLIDAKHRVEQQLMSMKNEFEQLGSQYIRLEQDLHSYQTLRLPNLSSSVPIPANVISSGEDEAMLVEQVELLKQKIDLVTRAQMKTQEELDEIIPEKNNYKQLAQDNGKLVGELRGQLNAAANVHNQFKKTIALLTQELQSNREKLNECDQIKASYHDVLHKLRLEKERVEAMTVNENNLHQDITSLREKLSQVERELCNGGDDVNILIANMSAMERNLEDAKNREVELLGQVGEAEIKQQEAEVRQAKTQQSLDIKIVELNRLRLKCEEDIKGLLASYEQEKFTLIQRHKNKEDMMHKDIELLHGDLSKSRTALDISTRNLDVLKTQVQQLNISQDQFRSETARALTEATASATEFYSKYIDSEERCQRVEKDLKQAQLLRIHERDDHVMEIDKLRSLVERLSSETRSLQEKYKETKMLLEAEQENAKDAQFLLKSKLDTLTKQLQTAVESRVHDVKLLESKLQESDNITETLINDTRARIIEHDREVNNLKSNNRSLLTQTREEMTRLLNENGDLSIKVKSLDREVTNLKSHIKSNDNERKQLKEQLIDSRNESDALLITNHELKTTLEHTRTTLNKMQLEQKRLAQKVNALQQQVTTLTSQKQALLRVTSSFEISNMPNNSKSSNSNNVIDDEYSRDLYQNMDKLVKRHD